MITALLILIPVAGSVAVMFSKKESIIRMNALIITIIEAILAFYIYFASAGSGSAEFQVSVPWLETAGVNFRFAIDGISLPLVLLVAVVFPITLLASWTCGSRRLNILFGLLLLMEGAFMGVFTTRDGIVFYLFWELSLIAAYFITAFWGGKNRIRITFKFFIYTMTGSLLMLAALIWLYLHTPDPHSADITALCSVVATKEQQFWLFIAFFAAFAIKMPLIPFHTWQPDIYTDSPLAGSITLAALMSKMGVYGLIRLLLPVCTMIVTEYRILILIPVALGIVYASLMALRQTDMKRFIAWVSIAHIGMIAAGVFSLSAAGINGAVVQMTAHGINVTGMFIITDIIEKRYGTRQTDRLGGIASVNSPLAIIFMIVLLGTVALPLTNGFAGEFMLMLGIFSANAWISFIAGTSIVFSAVYMLRLYQKTMLGPFNGEILSNEKIQLNELVAIIPIVILVIAGGLFPGFITDVAGPAVKNIIEHISTLSLLPN